MTTLSDKTIDNMANYRQAEHPVDPLFLRRWSPRALSADERVSEEELMSLFEAARWAPSSYNGQPWRFLYARRGGTHWDLFLNLLVDFNREWASKASFLLTILSRKTFEWNGKDAVTHSFDAGAAWQNLALQASLNGIVAHGMQGFDYEKARRDLSVPDEYSVEAMIAIGKPGEKQDLPAGMQEKEVPSGRKSVNEWAHEGVFPSR